MESTTLTESYRADTEIGRPEVMRPLGHAVRLVDAGERDRREAGEDAGRRAAADAAAADQHLGRQQQEVHVAGGNLLHDGAALERRHVGVDARATHTLWQLTHLHHRNDATHLTPAAGQRPVDSAILLDGH